MKPFVPFLALVCALLPMRSSAFLWMGGEKKALVKEAESYVKSADLAHAEGRVMDEVTLLGEAQDLYHRVLAQYPEYRAEFVQDQYARTAERVQELLARIRSGDVVLSEEENRSMAPTEGSYVSVQQTDAKRVTSPDHPSFRGQMPELVRTSSSTKIAPEPTAVEAAKPTAAPVPKPAVAKSASPVPVIAETPQVEEEGGEDDSRVLFDKMPADPVRRIAFLQGLIRAGNAADAVLFCEDFLEHEEAPDVRFCLVRALLECRNYKRADREFAKLPDAWASRADARSLRAATAVGLGNYPEALLQLDALTREAPTWADVYIDLAYVTMLQDPAKNRKAAREYYRQALVRGARRDLRLESALGLQVAR